MAHYQEAVAAGRKAIDIDPGFPPGYYNLAADYIYLDRLKEAEDTLRRAAARGLETDEFIILAYDIASLRDDRAGMQREAARARRRSEGDNWISNKEALALAYSGHLQEARDASRRAAGEGGSVGNRSGGARGVFRKCF
jgi:tetratricopeptide (TPR) repeat protein